MKLNVIPQRPDLLRGCLKVKIRLMGSWWERPGKVAMVATAKGAEGDADDLAPTAGSPVFQDCSSVSRERRR